MIDIRNCRFANRCNQRWDQLEPLAGEARMRFCGRCQTAVHRADNELEFVDLARQGKCVALFVQGERLAVGQPEIPPYVHGKDIE